MRYNRKVNPRSKTTTNLAGGEAYKVSAELELVSTLLTTFAENQFYRKASQVNSRLLELVDDVRDKKFVAQAAIFARTKFGMRSASHLLATALADKLVKVEWMPRFIEKVIIRPDDMLEILAAFASLRKLDPKKIRPIPYFLRKGFANALAKFDSYQLAKYRGDSYAVKLVDIVNLVRPKPSEKNKEAIAALVADTLRSTETWETKLTQAGQRAETEYQKEELKKEVWIELVRSRKIGYFALLRNLSNIMQQAPEVLDFALEMLIDHRLIRTSLVLPFRFYTAYRELQNTFQGHPNFPVQTVLDALDTAAFTSLSNIPLLTGKTLVALDVSGSMKGRPFDVGSMFATALVLRNKADLITFSETSKYFTLRNKTSIFKNIEDIARYSAWAGTNFHSIFLTARYAYDRIIILSDMQAWMGYRSPAQTSFSEYKRRFQVDPVVFSFDLQHYGSLQFPEDKVYALAGWSEKVFDIMALLETDRRALLHEIEAIEI